MDLDNSTSGRKVTSERERFVSMEKSGNVQFGLLMNNALMNIPTQVFVWACIFMLLGSYQEQNFWVTVSLP